MRCREYNTDKAINPKGCMTVRTTINIDDRLLKETESIYKAGSRSKSIEYALRDALQLKKLERLKELVGKVEFDEAAIHQVRNIER